LGVVVENYFESKKERFETVFEEYMDKELQNIISNCSRRYRKSDPALKDFCPNKEFVENIGTEFLIIKEEEFITRASEYFDNEEKILDIKTYC
jgi:AcrR family transcriptional regulator